MSCGFQKPPTIFRGFLIFTKKNLKYEHFILTTDRDEIINHVCHWQLIMCG
jgi:hypothetical protein